MDSEKTRRSGLILVAVFSVVLLACSGAFFWWSKGALEKSQVTLVETQDQFRVRTAEIEAEELQRTREAEAAKVKREQAQADRQDEAYEDAGFDKVAEDIYAYSFDPSEFTCGYWNCGFVQFRVEKDCPTHLFVEVAWESNGVIVNSSNDMSPALRKGDDWVAEFSDTSEQGDTYRFTKISCQ